MLGVRAALGGRHPALGTRNALLGLGPGRYFEILGPDPDAPRPAVPRPMGLDDLREPRLGSWAAKASSLDVFATRAAARGIDIGRVRTGSRMRPDGVTVSWTSTDSAMAHRMDGLVPFFIDWGDSPHPSESAPSGCELVELCAEHPRAEALRSALVLLGLELRVDTGQAPALEATLRSPAGTVTLR